MYAVSAGALHDGAALHGPSAVVIADGRIDRICPPDAVPAGVDVTNYGATATILPGLIDCHVHTAFDATDQAALLAREAADDVLLNAMRQSGHRMLQAGITTVRDLGDREYLSLQLRSEFQASPTTGPELVCAGPPMTTPSGHCWFLGGETAPTSDALKAAVATRAEHGVDVIKIMLNGGTLSQNGSTGLHEQFDANQLHVVVEEAARHNLPVAAHAHTPAAISDAVTAEVSTIEHGGFMTPQGVQPDETVLTKAAQRGIAISATAGFAPRHVTDRTSRIRDAVRTGLASAHRNEVPIVIGTDAGLAPSKPHTVLPHAADDLSSAGYSPAEILETLTSRAAEACDLGQSKGSLAAGYDADLIVLDGNPLADISTLTAPAAVYRMGAEV